MDGLYCLLTDKINAKVFETAGNFFFIVFRCNRPICFVLIHAFFL